MAVYGNFTLTTNGQNILLRVPHGTSHTPHRLSRIFDVPDMAACAALCSKINDESSLTNDMCAGLFFLGPTRATAQCIVIISPTTNRTVTTTKTVTGCATATSTSTPTPRSPTSYSQPVPWTRYIPDLTIFSIVGQFIPELFTEDFPDTSTFYSKLITACGMILYIPEPKKDGNESDLTDFSEFWIWVYLLVLLWREGRGSSRVAVEEEDEWEDVNQPDVEEVEVGEMVRRGMKACG